MSDIDREEDPLKPIKSAFKAGCTIAAFMLPVLVVWAVFRRSN
jgi:hypothetical protein